MEVSMMIPESGLNNKRSLPFQSSSGFDKSVDGEHQINSIPLQYGEVEL